MDWRTCNGGNSLLVLGVSFIGNGQATHVVTYNIFNSAWMCQAGCNAILTGMIHESKKTQ